MGFRDFLGDVFDTPFVSKLGETLQDTGWAIGAPFATAIDLARAGFSDKITVGSALAEGVNRGTQLFLGDNQGDENPANDRENLISPSVHKVMDGLEWVYDNAVTPAASMQAMTGQRVLADLEGVQDNKNPLNLLQTWQDASDNKTSIGREQAYFWYGLLGTPIGDHRGLTDEGQKLLDEKSKSFDVLSGSFDFGNRLVLDPTIVLGKATKALKFAAFIRNVKDPEQIAKLLDEGKKFGGLFDGFGERLDNANKFNMGVRPDGGVRSANEIYMANRGLQETGGDGWAIAQAMESANRSMRAAGASEDEILQAGRTISLAGIGDPVALKNIDSRAAEARDALAALRSSRDDLKMAEQWATKQNGVQAYEAANRVATKYKFADDVANRGQDYLASDEFLAMTGERLKAIQSSFQAAQREAARTEKLKNLFTGDDSLEGALANRPLLGGVRGGTAGMAARAAKESGQKVDRAKWNPARLDFVFQTSAWNKAVKFKAPQLLIPHIYYGVKAHQMLSRVQAPRTIEMHDENAPLALNNFLKHSAVDPAKREELVSQLAGARTEAAKKQVVDTAVSHAQASMIDKYMRENPHFSAETAQTVINEQAKVIQREATRMGLQTKKFTAHLKDDGTPGDVTVGEDGVATYRPLLETQLENQVVLPDLRAFTKILDRHSGWLEDMAQWAQGNNLPDEGRIKEVATKLYKARVEKKPGFDVRTQNRIQSFRDKEWALKEFMTTGLTGLMKAWKYGVLLRPAYPMRVLVDSDLRAMAVVGPAAFAMHAAPRAFGFATMGSASRIRSHFAAHADELKLTDIQTDLEKFEDAWKASNDGPIVDETYDDLRKQASEIEKRLDLYRTGGRKGRNEAYGRFGEVGLNDVQTAVGKIPGAFADDYGRQQRANISSKLTAGLMGDSQKLALSHLMTENWTSLEASDAGHMPAWLHAINAQIKNSELGKQALIAQKAAGDNPEAAVRRLMTWERSTPEGRAVMARMGWTGADREAHAREVVGMVNHYLPTKDLREKAIDSRIGQKDLESLYPNPLDRPPVHGNSLAMSLGRGSKAGKAINNWFERTMKWLSDAPEDQLARHPMYAAVYEQEAKRQAELILANPRIKDIGLDEIHSRVQKVAHKKAARAIKTYMFDIATQSDLSHAARFVSPFIAAWEDTIKKWGKIAADNPDLPGKAYLAWNAPNDMGLVVDENGNKVGEDDFNSNSFMIVQMPSWAPFAAGKKLKVVDSNFRIPKQAMNIVLQGGLQPGFGPLVAIPVGALQTSKPEINDVAKFINPYGPPESVWDAVAPSTAKRVWEATHKQSNAHMYDTERIYMGMLGEYRKNPEKFGNKAPEWADAEQRAKAVGMLKIVNNFANPFPAIFDSPYKLYQDSYRDLQNKERIENHPRGWADKQFIDAWGESFFPLVQSMSKNNAGLGATAEAKNASDRYAKQISKYGMEAGAPNKRLIQLIVGPEGEGEYNASAHAWQQTREISPASGYTFRDTANAQDAAADADADLGWYKYRQFMNTIDAQANQEGLRSAAEDPALVEAKKQFIQNLGEEIPSWRVDYDSMDTEKFTRDLEKVAELANSNTFGVQRTDMAGIRQYLVLRQALTDQLQQFGISEGSQEAVPLKQQFTDAVMDLVGSNTMFSEFAFHPFLERDPLLEGLVLDPSTGQMTLDQTANQWGFS